MPTQTSNQTPAASATTKPETLAVDELTDRPNAKAADLQFPSQAGKPNVEVAERAADVDKASSPAFEKVFVLLRRDWAIADQDEIHAANKRATREYLIHQGLRSGDVDVEFVGEEDVPEPDSVELDRDRSVGLRYRVASTPAVIATEAQNRANVDGQAVNVDGSTE